MAIYFYIDSKKCKPKCKECGDDGCGGGCGRYNGRCNPVHIMGGKYV